MAASHKNPAHAAEPPDGIGAVGGRPSRPPETSATALAALLGSTQNGAARAVEADSAAERSRLAELLGQRPQGSTPGPESNAARPASRSDDAALAQLFARADERPVPTAAERSPLAAQELRDGPLAASPSASAGDHSVEDAVALATEIETSLIDNPLVAMAAREDADRTDARTDLPAFTPLEARLTDPSAATVDDPAPVVGEVVGYAPPTAPRVDRRRRNRRIVAIASSVALIALVIAGVFWGYSAYTENQQLDAARNALAAAEEGASSADELVDPAYAAYAESLAAAQAAADGAAPALPAVDGMADPTLLANATAALSALQAAIAATALPERPQAYEPFAGEGDAEKLTAAAGGADDHESLVRLRVGQVEDASAALEGPTAALRDAQVALGSSLPATAQVIVTENGLAAQELRDAVVSAAAAVGTAQAAGGSGDPELLAYSQAVAAVRTAQAEAVKKQSTTRPRTNTTPSTPVAPTAPTTPDPAPAPDPSPTTPPPPDSTPAPVP